MLYLEVIDSWKRSTVSYSKCNRVYQSFLQKYNTTQKRKVYLIKISHYSVHCDKIHKEVKRMINCKKWQLTGLMTYEKGVDLKSERFYSFGENHERCTSTYKSGLPCCTNLTCFQTRGYLCELIFEKTMSTSKIDLHHRFFICTSVLPKKPKSSFWWVTLH